MSVIIFAFNKAIADELQFKLAQGRASITPNPQQADTIIWALTGTGSANIVARAGCGKCLGRGTKVMKFDGSIVNVEDVVVGDFLMGPDSSPRSVLETTFGRGKCYQVTPTKGDPWVCNSHHVMTLVGSIYHSGEIIDIELGEHLATCNTTDNSKEWKLFRVPVSFPDQPVEYDPYVVGTWLGDGTVGTTQWTLGYKKEGVRDYLRDMAKAGGHIFKCVEDLNDECWNVAWRMRELGEKGFAQYERYPFRTFVNTRLFQHGEKRIPVNYLHNTRSIRAQVLAGLLDTDGSMHGDCGFEITTKYFHLKEDILFLCRSLGLSAYGAVKMVQLEGWGEARPYYRVSISGDLSWITFLRHTPKPRRQVKNVLRTGWKVEDIGNQDYFGFTLSGDGRFLLGDFTVTHNSSTLLELARQIDTQVYAGTFHSLGLKIWRQSGYRSEIDGHKVKNLARMILPWDKKMCGLVAQAVSFAKQSAFGVTGSITGTEEDWATLIEYYGIDDEITQVSSERFIKDCAKVYQQSLTMCTAKESIIDFDDMLLAPLHFLSPKPSPVQYDWVFVDEVQDSNQSRRLLARWVMRPQGRMVCVGDDRQAIYHFAGASSNAMQLIKEQNNACEFPLNVTYRCPRKIVEMAQTWVPDFTAHESAPDGEVSTIDHTDFWCQTFRTTGDDVIICRNTRPLVGIAMWLRERGIPCLVEGQAGQAIIKLVLKWGDVPVDEFLLKLAVWYDDEKTKWEIKKRLDKVEMIQDRVGVIRSIASRLNDSDSVRKIVARVEMLFGDDNRQDVLRLCTIHRSKGREWDRVFLIGRSTYQPSKWAESDEEKKQEENLMYVAITRVKRELVEVEVPKKLSADSPDWWEM